MRALTITLMAAGLLLGSLPAQEPVEPGVFVYSYDEVNDTFLRTYHSTQAEAQEALRPAREAAITAVTNLKNQIGNNSINVEVAADWLIFSEQWHYYQQWVAEEYDLGEELLEDPEAADARFAAVPGTTLRHVREQQEAEQAVADAVARVPAPGSRAALGFEGGVPPEFVEGGPVAIPGVPGAQGQQAQPEGPAAAITLANFAYLGGARTTEQQQREIVDIIQVNIAKMVEEKAEEHEEDLLAILEAVELEQDRREQRQAAIAARQRDIHELREVILDREEATEVQIEGRTYLFSNEPLRQQPTDAINITTPNLTPYDMFDQDGTPRQP